MSIIKKSEQRIEDVERIAQVSEKQLAKAHKETEKAINKIVSENLSKYGIDDKFNYREMVKFNRKGKMDKEIAKEMRKVTSETDVIISKQLVETSQFSYLFQKYIQETELQIFTNPKRLSEKVVLDILNKPVAGKTLEERIKDNGNINYQRLRTSLTDGMVKGEGIQKMSKRIRDDMEISKNRADTIARTEGLRVASETQQMADTELQNSGIELVKEWISTLDKRTRSNHRTLDGKKVDGVDGLFRIDGHSAPYPREFGVASEDINCRCTVATTPKGFDNEAEFRRARGRDGKNRVIPNTTYKEWEKQRVKD